MSAGEFFVAAIVVGMVLAIIAFSIRHSTRHTAAPHDGSGASGIDPGIAHLMTTGTLSAGHSHAGSHHGHANDYPSEGSVDGGAPVDSSGFDGGGGGDGGGGD